MDEQDTKFRLNKMKRLIRSWIRAIMKELQAPTQNLTEVEFLEREMLSEVMSLLRSRGVDTSALEAKINTLVDEAPKMLFEQDFDERRIQGLVEGLKSEAELILSNPGISDLASDLSDVIMKILSDPEILNLGALFVQEAMTLMTDPAKVDDKTATENVNSLMKDIFSRIADRMDELDEENEVEEN